VTIRPINPDEMVTVNGVQLNGRRLAKARQELSHRGVHNPQWDELSQHDQDVAALSAAGWLRALTDVLDGAEPDDDLGPSPAQMGETMTVAAGEWTPLDDHGTQIYVYGCRSVDIAFQTRPDV
jgi:hypothetical protein